MTREIIDVIRDLPGFVCAIASDSYLFSSSDDKERAGDCIAVFPTQLLTEFLRILQDDSPGASSAEARTFLDAMVMEELNKDGGDFSILFGLRKRRRQVQWFSGASQKQNEIDTRLPMAPRGLLRGGPSLSLPTA
ncbi:hypothetical protein ACF3NT_11265 [Naumannella halotolerans]|uniref:hypothetical protein n=1 Tax=Naumannella halotolerans TaxID=993414 RepID=UPI00370D2563